MALRIKLDEVPDMAARPYQPSRICFPSRTFGDKKRKFQQDWFAKWEWIHYDVGKDAAFCFVCCKAAKARKYAVSEATERAFLVKGYTNWKNACVRFGAHEKSNVHKSCCECLASTTDIAEMLNEQIIQQRLKNRKYLLVLMSTIRFLARQGLALRGHGDESDSNMLQLLHLLEGDHISPQRLHRYTSHDVQNEMTSIMAQQVIRLVSADVRSASFFTVMADETTDNDNKEQVVVGFRWVDDDLRPHEEFVGLYSTDSVKSEALVSIIKDTILRMDLNLSRCRGQCYDGASAMAGSKNGVAKIICDEEPRALLTHCYGHALSLAVGDCVKQSRVMRNALGDVHEISKLIKNSPKRDAAFDRIKAELAPDTPGFRVLCPTRWTVRAASLKSVIDNYEVLLRLWPESAEDAHDAQLRARIRGIEMQMKTFDFLYGVSLAALILNHSDNLSKALQSQTISAAEGQRIAKLTLNVLHRLRTEDSFKSFFALVKINQEKFSVNHPHLERNSNHSNAESCYRQVYYECIDFVTGAISNRFDQPGYRIYSNLESMLVKASRGEDFEQEIGIVCNFYGKDVEESQLRAQLALLQSACENHDICDVSDVIKLMRGYSASERIGFKFVCMILKLLLVMPATNAGSERSFSALRRIKSYLRTTMTQRRLNSLMVLHVHKEKTDRIDLRHVGDEFVAEREGRRRVFGKFA